MIVTISREYGAGGSEIARRVAAALGWRLVDNEVIDRVARESGLPADEVALREERAPGFLERLTRALSRAAPELFPRPPERVPEPEEAALVRATEKAVAELARGDHVVVVGRAAAAVLSHLDALHVRVVAPRPARLARAIQRLGTDRETARKVVEDTDAARGRYHRQYYGRDWSDPANYHMVLNSEALGVEGAARLIEAEVRLRSRAAKS